MKDLIRNVYHENPSLMSLIENWINGNCKDVIDSLWRYPPHITAQFILHFAEQDMEEANRIANRLMDKFTMERDKMRKLS